MTLSILEFIGIIAGSGLTSALITSLINHSLTKNRDFENRQWLIKRDACLDALSAIDSAFSHRVWTDVPKQPTKQKVDISKIRECHSKLTLSCNNVETIEMFLQIMLGEEKPTELLNEFRNLIRGELDFGNKLNFNRTKAWIGSIGGDAETIEIPEKSL